MGENLKQALAGGVNQARHQRIAARDPMMAKALTSILVVSERDFAEAIEAEREASIGRPGTPGRPGSAARFLAERGVRLARAAQPAVW